MRHLLLMAFMITSAGLASQLRVSASNSAMAIAADAGAQKFGISPDKYPRIAFDRTALTEPVSGRDLLPSYGAEPFAYIPLSRAAPFRYADTKPYLAFFCRLELDIEEATKFPVRFRLGEVRSWQQELSKRE